MKTERQVAQSTPDPNLINARELVLSSLLLMDRCVYVLDFWKCLVLWIHFNELELFYYQTKIEKLEKLELLLNFCFAQLVKEYLAMSSELISKISITIWMPKFAFFRIFTPLISLLETQIIIILHLKIYCHFHLILSDHWFSLQPSIQENVLMIVKNISY